MHILRILVSPAALYILVANTYQLPQDSPSSLIPLPHSMTGPNLILNAPSICSRFSPHIASQIFFA